MSGNNRSIELRSILSRNIKLFRHYRAWSQADLADRAGISITFLSDIERGNKWPHPDTLSNIADALDIEVYQLFIREKPANNSDMRDTMTRFTRDITIVFNEAVEKLCNEYLSETENSR
jgi:transcriptional regulator with XRE-family HTH domain